MGCRNRFNMKFKTATLQAEELRISVESFGGTVESPSYHFRHLGICRSLYQKYDFRIIFRPASILICERVMVIRLSLEKDEPEAVGI